MMDGVEQGCHDFIPDRDYDKHGERGGRGLPGYLRFVDIDGNNVNVSGSSAAMRHCVRVFVTPPEDRQTPRPTPSGIVHPAERPASMHLCRGMAAELAAALERFLAEPVDLGLRCELTVNPAGGNMELVEQNSDGWVIRCACGNLYEGTNPIEARFRAIAPDASFTTITIPSTGNQAFIEHLLRCGAYQAPSRHQTVVFVDPLVILDDPHGW